LLTSPDKDYLFNADEGSPTMNAFQVTNAGGQTSGPLKVSLTGAVQQFKIVGDTCSSSALKAKSSCLVTVQFSSDTAGTFAGQLHFNAAPASLVINMSGQVTLGSIAPTTPAPVHVLQGSSATAQISLSNRGGASCRAQKSHPVSGGRLTTVP
jgi:hypothetical protein